jgi:hypothetical protein
VGGQKARDSVDVATNKKAKQKISKKRRFLDLTFKLTKFLKNPKKISNYFLKIPINKKLTKIIYFFFRRI